MSNDWEKWSLTHGLFSGAVKLSAKGKKYFAGLDALNQVLEVSQHSKLTKSVQTKLKEPDTRCKNVLSRGLGFSVTSGPVV